MAWLQKRIVFPIKRLAFAVKLRMRSIENYDSIMRLYDMIRSDANGDEDLHLLFDMFLAAQTVKPRRRWVLTRRPSWLRQIGQQLGRRRFSKPDLRRTRPCSQKTCA